MTPHKDHKDGWIIQRADTAIDMDTGVVDVDVICNAWDCKETAKFRLMIADVQRIR